MQILRLTKILFCSVKLVHPHKFCSEIILKINKKIKKKRIQEYQNISLAATLKSRRGQCNYLSVHLASSPDCHHFLAGDWLSQEAVVVAAANPALLTHAA